MDIRDLLKQDESFKKFTETKQYKYANEMIKLRFEGSYSVEEMANKLGIPFKEYVALESGDTMVSEETYVRTLIDMNQVIINYLERKIEEQIKEKMKIMNKKYKTSYTNTKNQNNYLINNSRTTNTTIVSENSIFGEAA